MSGFLDFIKPVAKNAFSSFVNGGVNDLFWRQRANYEDELRQKWFDKVNAYNTPANQRRRIEEAGLNPALMMGGSGAGSSISAQAGFEPNLSPTPPQNNYADTALIASQIKLNEANANKADSDANRNTVLNKLTESQSAVQRALAGVHNADAAGKRINNALANLNLAALSQTFKVATGMDTDGNIEYTEMNSVSAKAFAETLEVTSKNIDALVKQGTVREYLQSVLDQFAIVGEQLREAKANAAIAEIRQGIEKAAQYAKIAEPYMHLVKEFSDIAINVVEGVMSVKSAAAKIASLFGKKITTTDAFDGDGT
ncbi:DNA pilot protein [Dipodfec virus UOA04_Rod_626]|nr:DNA pilot protein [Dipodfec virus UOA04_Rod_626]